MSPEIADSGSKGCRERRCRGEQRKARTLGSSGRQGGSSHPVRPPLAGGKEGPWKTLHRSLFGSSLEIVGWGPGSLDHDCLCLSFCWETGDLAHPVLVSQAPQGTGCRSKRARADRWLLRLRGLVPWAQGTGRSSCFVTVLRRDAACSGLLISRSSSGTNEMPGTETRPRRTCE